MRALSFFGSGSGRPAAAKRARAAKQERRGEESGDGIDGHGVWPWELGRRLAGSLHLRTLRPFRRRRRCICSCDLDACLLTAPHVNLCCAVVFTRDLIYRRPVHINPPYAAQIRRPSPLPSLAHPRAAPALLLLPLQAVSHAAISGSHSIRQRGKVKPSATCHRPPTPLYSRASLNLVAAVSTSSLPAAVRPFDPKTASTLYRQSLQEPAYCYAPATLLSPNALADPI